MMVEKNEIVISIIIPTYNRRCELLICLDALMKQVRISENLQIVVSDDSNNLNLSKEIALTYPDIEYQIGPHKGPAANRNSAAKNAKGQWLIFLDDDCIPSENWFKNYNKEIHQTKGTVLEGKTIVNRPTERYDEVAPINLDGGKLWSCNFAIQKNLFLSLGGFDEGFLYTTMEDVDFKDRVKQQTQIAFIAESVVVHPWRKRIAFANFNGRLKSQAYYYQKQGTKNTTRFRIDRMKIWLTGMFMELAQLASFSYKGWRCYLDKVLFNFCMIFI
jgi:GT2 family glycosyltransferase